MRAQADVFEPLVLWEAGPEEGDHRVSVDPRLCKWLRPHQREGVQFMFECGERTCSQTRKTNGSVEYFFLVCLLLQKKKLCLLVFFLQCSWVLAPHPTRQSAAATTPFPPQKPVLVVMGSREVEGNG